MRHPLPGPRAAPLVLAAALLVVVAACARQPPPPPVVELPGFWRGLGHGLVAPIALVVELFKDVRIYAYPNGGGWYDLGFLIGVGVWGRGSRSLRRD